MSTSTHHPEGCTCAGLDGVCSDAVRRSRVRALRREMEDSTAHDTALTAAATKGERVVGVGAPPSVLNASEVLAQFTEPAG